MLKRDLLVECVVHAVDGLVCCESSVGVKVLQRADFSRDAHFYRFVLCWDEQEEKSDVMNFRPARFKLCRTEIDVEGDMNPCDAVKFVLVQLKLAGCSYTFRRNASF